MAQSTLHLEFESAGPHQVWISDDSPTTMSTDITKTSTDIPVDASLKIPSVWVWNRQTGNMAMHPLPDLKGKWVLKDSDYTMIGRVVVRVESKGQPVASAEIIVSGLGLMLENLISPGDKGELSFFAIHPGQLTLTVKYKIAGKEADPIKQSFDLAMKRDKADPTLIVSIPDAVDVVPSSAPVATPVPGASPAPAGGPVAAPPGAPAPGAAPAPAGGGGSWFGQAITIILVLGFILGGGYFLMQAMKKNGTTVQDKLRQLGVDIPQPVGTTNPIDAVAPAPIAPAPPQKIMLGDSTPDPIALSAAPVSAPISMSSGVPTLRMANGDAFELPEGETVVGRDLGLGLSLVNESTVSRRHASVTRAGTNVRVIDHGSSNGTFVNGVKVVGEATLHPGDSVQFGAVQCRYEG
jgi:hypothetical protein